MKVKKALSPPDHNENRSSDAKQLSPERQFDRDLSVKKEALEQIHRQAAEGDPQAQYELAHFLASQDNAVGLAVRWYTKAANQGHTDAQNALAEL